MAILREQDDRVDDAMLIARVVLDEPTKSELGSAQGDHGGDRRAAITVVPGPGPAVLEAVVSLTAGKVVRCTEISGVRPALLFDESINAIVAVMENDEWQQAMRRRGIDDFAKVQLDPWPAGSFGVAHETDRRITRVLSYLRDDPNDNGYARPIEGVLVFVDLATSNVLEVQDHGVLPVPADKGSYCAGRQRADRAPVCARSTSSRPTGPASRSKDIRSAGNAGHCGCRWTRTRGSCSTPSATRTAAACARSCIAPR